MGTAGQAEDETAFGRASMGGLSSSASAKRAAPEANESDADSDAPCDAPPFKCSKTSLERSFADDMFSLCTHVTSCVSISGTCYPCVAASL